MIILSKICKIILHFETVLFRVLYASTRDKFLHAYLSGAQKLIPNLRQDNRQAAEPSAPSLSLLTEPSSADISSEISNLGNCMDCCKATLFYCRTTQPNFYFIYTKMMV